MPEYLAPRLIEGTSALSEELAAGGAEPPGGAIAGLVAAWSASLVAAAADRSRAEWEGAGGARAQARALRARAIKLAEHGARAHTEALQTLEGVRSGSSSASEDARDWEVGRAVQEAAEAPFQLAACGLDIAQLAQMTATHAVGDVQADAVVAAQLAAAAAAAGAHLVAINLVVGGDSGPAKAARELARAAAGAAAAAAGVVE
jgi:formiminotetrahydrofolate cyclodeaminase